jgi:hypothetical protein
MPVLIGAAYDALLENLKMQEARHRRRVDGGAICV